MDIKLSSGSTGTAIAGHATNFENLCGVELGTTITCEVLEARATAKSADGTNAIGDIELLILAAGTLTGGSAIASCANLGGGPTALTAAPFTTFFAAQPRTLSTAGAGATEHEFVGDALAPQAANYSDGPPRGAIWKVLAGKVLLLRARWTQAQTVRWTLTLRI